MAINIECADKNNPLEELLYFSNGNKELSQTFRLHMRVFTLHFL